jgi:hypothetical protein
VVVKSPIFWDITLENLIAIERSKFPAKLLSYARNKNHFPALYLLSNIPFPEG